MSCWACCVAGEAGCRGGASASVARGRLPGIWDQGEVALFCSQASGLSWFGSGKRNDTQEKEIIWIRKTRRVVIGCMVPLPEDVARRWPLLCNTSFGFSQWGSVSESVSDLKV